MAPGSRYHLSKPVIGVTGSHRRWSPSWNCIRLSVWLAGGKAVRISVKHEVDIDRLDALVISGGDDIHPSIYGADAMSEVSYDRARDQMEQEHIEYALDTHLPLLGICRGYQLINAVCGGNLYIDIRGMRKHTSNRATLFPVKTVYLAEDSRLKKILKVRTLKVNSLHYQAINRLAGRFIASATDKDNFLQGIESQKGIAVLGVQWHPEYLFYMSAHRQLFQWLVNEAKKINAKSKIRS